MLKRPRTKSSNFLAVLKFQAETKALSLIFSGFPEHGSLSIEYGKAYCSHFNLDLKFHESQTRYVLNNQKQVSSGFILFCFWQ